MHGARVSIGYEVTTVMGRWRYFTLNRDKTTCKKDVPVNETPRAKRQPVRTEVLSVFPNPSTGYIRIQGLHKGYLVYDHAGNLVEQVSKIAILRQGVYLITTRDGKLTQRVVIIE